MLLDPSSNDLTNLTFVTVGGLDNPGYLNATISLTNTGKGVYTVIMPDENGIPHTLYVGVFPSGYNSELECYVILFLTLVI